MYKQKNKTFLERSKDVAHWVRRRILLIIAAFMLGFYNVINEDDKTPHGSQFHIEQEQQQDDDKDF